MNGWRERLADLLAGRGQGVADELEAGAQLRFADPDRPPVPLARHHRIQDGDPSLLWIRPITGHYRAEGGADGFDLQIARRRAITFTAARLTGDGAVALTARDGTEVRIEPAGAEAMAEISRWDTFTLTVLTAAQEQVLNALASD